MNVHNANKRSGSESQIKRQINVENSHTYAGFVDFCFLHNINDVE